MRSSFVVRPSAAVCPSVWAVLRCALFVLLLCSTSVAQTYRRLPLNEYRERMEAGWIGQMIGVGWGAPTEFKYLARIIPDEAVPMWTPAMVNQFGQDDLYVEMTFLRTLEVHGWDVSPRQAGIDFANSNYRLWHANSAARALLREGIAPPDSGHPQFNPHADDIDYQIEADFSGLIAPGLPQVAIDLGEIFGRVMNYGDGVYGGQFVGAMYAAAFFERDPLRIVQAGLACIPAGTQYRECVEDVIRWHREFPGDWEAAWQRIEDKYNRDPAYRRFSCSGPHSDFNIDAKINGAYIVLGLLYGGGDIEQTIRISMRAGQDSDCNPSSAAGILCTALGLDAIPARFREALNRQAVFAYTAYSFDRLLAVSEQLAKQAVERAGGRIERDPRGQDVMVIPLHEPRPGERVQAHAPTPPHGTRFTPVELSQIHAPAVQAAADRILPGWTVMDWDLDHGTGYYSEIAGRPNVLMLHGSPSQPARLVRPWQVAPTGSTRLDVEVARDPWGQCAVEVRVDDEVVHRVVLNRESAPDPWTTFTVDLTAHAGREVNLELRGQGTALWRRLDIVVRR
jgi:hypothetical protein